MVKPEQVPDASGAALKDMLDRLAGSDIPIEDICLAAIAAALNAWPGMTVAKWRAYGMPDRVVLPLPQEKTNADNNP